MFYRRIGVFTGVVLVAVVGGLWGAIARADTQEGSVLPKTPGNSLADAEAIAKRCLDTMPTGKWPSSNEVFAAKEAVRLAESGVKSNAAGFRPTLLILSKRLAGTIAAFDQYTPDSWLDEAQNMLGTLVWLRLMSGDSSAKADYEAWIYQSAPHDEGFRSYERFRPLVEDPSWGDTVAKRVFLGASAPWNPTVALRKGQFLPLEGLLRSRLLMLPSVRECLVVAMLDPAVIGEVWRTKDGGTKFKTARGGGGIGASSRNPGISDPRDPGDEVKRPLRVGDYVAMKLSTFRGAPPYRAYWSDKDRNEALSQLIRFVKEDGASFVDRRPWKEPGER